MHFEVHQPGNRNALGSHQRRGSNNTPYERSLPSKDGPEQTFALGTVPQCGCTEAAVRFLMQHFHRLNGS